MRIAIIGFQSSGKTTLFNALTGQRAETSAFGGGKVQTHLASVKVPDPRLDKMSAMFKPKKHTPATVEYLDLAGIARPEGQRGDGLGEKQIQEIANADALLAVIRGFEDAAGEAPDVIGDVEAIALEMAFSDLKKVEGRLGRIEGQIMRAPPAEKRGLQNEWDALKLLRPVLEEGKPARAIELSAEQVKAIRGFQFLTLKPVMFVVNEDEAGWAARKSEPVPLGLWDDAPLTLGARLCGQTEMEIAHLAEADREAFLADLGVEEPAAHRVIRLCNELLGQLSFFTVGPDECRAWTVRRGATAPQAAGTIHSDLERGFIRAEVIPWDELLKAGSLAEAKKHGKLRLEGKEYIVQDGDTINVLFSV